MIYSMTGFGDAAAERDGSRYLVEIKSLNNRYFKPTIRLPEAVSALEPEIESILRKRVGRGSVVGCKSVVDQDVPPGVVVAGNPFRIIRHVDQPEL